MRRLSVKRVTEHLDTHTTACLDRRTAPKLVIGLIHGEQARGLELHFKAAGWRVCSADTTAELRAKAEGSQAAAIVLPVSACGGESGYLTCAKLIRSLPGVRVVMVGPESKRHARFAKFAGAAAYLPETATPAELARAICPR
jgi:DNA-binding NarL/FixJ family response regulator